MCNGNENLKIIIKNYDRENEYYHLTIDINEYNRNNLNLYFLIKKAYIDLISKDTVNNLSDKLLRFENNINKANYKFEIMSNRLQIFIFDEEGGFQLIQKDYVRKMSIKFLPLMKKLIKCFKRKKVEDKK